MDREKIEEEFHGLLDEVVDGIEGKLDVGKAVKRRSSSDTAAKMVRNSSRVREEIIRPEIEEHRKDLKHQFSRIIDLVENDEDVEEVRKELLERDIFHNNLKKEVPELEEKVMDRFKHLRESMERLRESEKEDVWEGVREEFTEEEAREFVDQMFGFLEEVEEHEEHLEYRKKIDLSKLSSLLPFSVDVDYTPEALEVMQESEDEVRQKLEKKVDELYEDEKTPDENSGDDFNEDSSGKNSEEDGDGSDTDSGDYDHGRDDEPIQL